MMAHTNLFRAAIEGNKSACSQRVCSNETDHHKRANITGWQA
jgi:hypothetical protein